MKKEKDEKITEKPQAPGLFLALFKGFCQLKGQMFITQFASCQEFQSYLIPQMDIQIEQKATAQHTFKELISLVVNNADYLSNFLSICPVNMQKILKEKIENTSEKINSYLPLASGLFKQAASLKTVHYINYLADARTNWGSDIELHLVSRCFAVNIVITDKNSRRIFSTDNSFTETLSLQQGERENHYFHSITDFNTKTLTVV